MSLELALWLFGAAFAATSGVLGFAWHCHTTRGNEMAKLREEFFVYKVHVAEHFSTVTSSVQMEKRMVDSLEEVKNAIKDQGAKIDRLIEGRLGK